MLGLLITLLLALDYTYVVDSYPSPYIRSHYIEVKHKIFKAGDNIFNPEFPEDIFYIASSYGRSSKVYMVRRVGWEEGEEDNFEIYFYPEAIIMRYDN